MQYGMKKRAASLAARSDENSRGGTRTPDPVINSHLLYQLSYSGKRNQYTDLPRGSQRRANTAWAGRSGATRGTPDRRGAWRWM